MTDDFGFGEDLDNIFSEDALDAFVNHIVKELDFADFNIIEKIEQCNCDETEEREALIAILCENDDMLQKAIYSSKI